MMICPRCDLPTVERLVSGLRVEACSRCQGMFLDRGQLNRVAGETDGDLEYATLHDDPGDRDDRFPEIGCPRCGLRPMAKVEFNIYTGIILDHCAGCEAFWLDGPELARIRDEVKRLDEQSGSDTPLPAMLWFARAMWNLPH